MSTIERAIPPLAPGQVLSREEFLRRWEAMPHVKFAELIRGVVYMPSPLSRGHGGMDGQVATWLGVYRAATPGCENMVNATHLLGDEETPQPDNSLRILPECSGQSVDEGLYVGGAPEFLEETCQTSAAHDLHEKFKVYQEAGVQEYVVVLMDEQEVRWHRLTDGHFRIVPPAADGIYRSTVFPGLWLDAAALLAGDLARVLAVLQQGITSPEHQAFVAGLARRRATGQGG